MARTLSASKTTADPEAPKVRRTQSGQTGEVAVPTVATVADGAPLPRHGPSAPFIYAWHPACWHVMAGKLVPRLRQMRMQPGLSNMGESPDGRVVTRNATAAAADRGWTTIAIEAGPGGSYLRKHKVSPNGRSDRAVTRWASAWETLYSGSDTIQSDEAGFVAWLGGLIDNGSIPACPAHIADSLALETESRLGRLQGEVAKGVDAVKPHLERAAADLAVLRAYVSDAATPAAGEIEQVEVDA